MKARDRFLQAATEAIWGCRLASGRIKTPTDEPAYLLERFPKGFPRGAWLYDWYAHVLFGSRLFEAAKALAGQDTKDKALRRAVKDFERHWDDLKPLRDYLLHPLSKKFNPEWLYALGDRIVYHRAEPGRIPDWEFTLSELDDATEALFAALPQSYPAPPPVRTDADVSAP
jgi:hypothetical protein